MNSADVPRAEFASRLQVAWEGRWRPFWESLCILLFHRTPLPAGVTAIPAFRDVGLRGLIPGRALVLSVALHVLLLILPLPHFLKQPPKRLLASSIRIEYDLRWAPATPFLPAIAPSRLPGKKLATGSKPQEALPAKGKGAEAYNPQTIVSNPPQPNHPRQTLLTQFATKTLRLRQLELPNIVIPPAPLQTGSAPPLAPPAVAHLQPVVPLPAMELENIQPRLARNVNAESTPAVKPPEVSAATAASGITAVGTGNLPGVVALNAQPARPTPVLEIPEAHLRARFTAGPQTGAGPPDSEPGAGIAAAGGAAVIQLREVLVSGGGAAVVQPVIAGPPPLAAAPAPTRAERQPAAKPAERAQELLDAITPGMRPGAAGRYRRVYTIYINMPNLTSQSGSWVLRFSELNEADQAAPGGASDDDDNGIAAPQAVKKVDPRYPPSARQERIEGTVLLYAVIRSDGAVTDVAVVRGVDARLDVSAVEAFRRWRFQPGTKNGHAINLEVLIEIPFRLLPLL